MKTFKDTQDREWRIALTVGAVKRINSDLDIDLADITNEAVMAKLMEPMILFEVIWRLVSMTDQAHAEYAEVTDEQFACSMGGDSIDGAVLAFREAWVDFFPKGRREALKTLLAKQAEVEAKAIEVFEDRMKDPKTMKLAETAIRNGIDGALQKLGGSFGN